METEIYEPPHIEILTKQFVTLVCSNINRYRHLMQIGDSILTENNNFAMVVVSVVIPTYNRANVLPRAINSVLNQTFTDFELIIVDDHSEEDITSIVDTFDDNRVKIIRHSSNRGGAAARNTGIEEASGKYIAFLDSDDKWDKRKLEKQLRILEDLSCNWIANYCDTHNKHNNRDVELLFPVVRKVLSFLERDIPKEGGTELIPYILSTDFNLGGASTLIVERQSVERIGGFDERFPRHQDWEFLIRLLKVGKLSHTEESLVTKYGWGEPDMETIQKSKKLLFDKFSEDVHKYEAEGYRIERRYNSSLLIMNLNRGKYKNSLRYLPKSSLCLRDYVSVLVAILKGVKV